MVFVLYGIGALLMAYIFSTIGKSVASGVVWYVVVSLFMGIVIPLIVYTMNLYGLQELNRKWWEAASWDRWDTIKVGSVALRAVLGIFPPVAASRAVMTIVQTQETNNVCSNNIALDALANMCGFLAKEPYFGHSKFDYFYRMTQCCEKPFIQKEEDTICGKRLYHEHADGSQEAVDMHPCSTRSQRSFFNWHYINGINIDMIILGADILALFILLVALDSGWLPRLKATLCTFHYSKVSLLHVLFIL